MTENEALLFDQCEKALKRSIVPNAEISRLRGLLERARASLVECSGDLAEHVSLAHPCREDYSDEMRKYELDMSPVESARSLAKEIEEELK